MLIGIIADKLEKILVRAVFGSFEPYIVDFLLVLDFRCGIHRNEGCNAGKQSDNDTGKRGYSFFEH